MAYDFAALQTYVKNKNIFEQPYWLLEERRLGSLRLYSLKGVEDYSQQKEEEWGIKRILINIKFQS